MSRFTTAVVVCAVAVVAWAILGAAYTALIDADKTIGAVAGAVVAAPIVAFELFVVRARIGEPLRQIPFWAMTVITTLVWMLSIAAGILIITPAILGFDPYPYWYDRSTFVQDAAVFLVVAFIISVSVRIHSLIGARMLLNFLLGRYHRPLRERCVFMFVDFLDARGLANRLGDLRAQSLISAVFFDIDGAIVELGGEPHRYLADELVVTWEFGRGTKDARCVKCALRIAALVRANAASYRDRFGEAPQLRMALHGGPVVVSEIGDDRREIVYFGDTINTTARLRGLAKKIRRTCLISAFLLEQVPLPSGIRVENMGSFALSGKALETHVYALHDGEVDLMLDAA